MITKPHKRTLSVLFAIKGEIDKSLRELYGKSLWNPSQLDCCRLVRLKVWSERYGVSVSYILSVLLPYHWGRLPKSFRAKAKNSKGLGLRIATLVGNESLQRLKDQIKEDFPEGENISTAREAEQDKIMALLEENRISKIKNVLHHRTIGSFLSDYRSSLNKAQKKERKLTKKMRRMPFRGNPWN